jgi:hypothetical protein
MTAPRFQIRSLGPWDRPITKPRASSARFRAPWDDTIGLLISEVEQLDGSLIVVQVDADPADIRRDGMLRARATVCFPGVKVSFESKHGPLTYATDAYEDGLYYGQMPGWQANVRAIALSLQALRAVDRYGVTHTGEQYRGWSQITAAPAESEMTPDEAARVLADATGVRPEFVRGFADLLADRTFVAAESKTEARAAINKLYRNAARTAHPDHGGNADVFRLITKARDVLLGGAA